MTNFSDPDFIQLLDNLEFHLKLVTQSRQYQRILDHLKNEDDFYTDLNDMVDGIEEAKSAFEETRQGIFATWLDEIENKTGQ
jgi:hypothetical protein